MGYTGVSVFLFIVFSAVLLCVPVCYASFGGIEEGNLRVVMPPGHKEKINVALANFGQAKYGASMMAELVYPSKIKEYSRGKSYTCSPVDCEYGCTMFNGSSPPFQITKTPGKSYVMLVDRGPNSEKLLTPCYFLLKVYHAQLAGADAVLVVNDHPGDLSTAIPPDDEEYLKYLPELTASAGLISQEDGNNLKALMKQGPVTISLNWTSIFPTSSQVKVEYWSNSNDECGTLCNEQKAFIKGFKATAKSLMQSGKIVFEPHYLVWMCPAEYLYTPECGTQCVRNGTYCCPDPDDNVDKGYKGSDVLKINVYQLCFFRVAQAAGQPWLWWDYADSFGDTCLMKDSKYTVDCAKSVFTQLGGPALLNNTGLQKWVDCVDESTLFNGERDTIPLLEDELKSQHGNESIAPVTILPTIRIDGGQFRGTLEVSSVTRAICSAFPKDQEPDVCNAAWVSGPNECDKGGIGYLACHTGDNIAAGKTNCINTFTGYQCSCGDGWLKMTEDDTGLEYCADINECLMTNIPQTDPACSCKRCACINTVGSYKCTGPLPEYCTAGQGYGGCWQERINGTFYHACMDNLVDYKDAVAHGDEAVPKYVCRCPPCFKGDGKTCVPMCSASECDNVAGTCVRPSSTSGMMPSGSSKQGMGPAGVVLTILVSIAATAGVMLAVYKYILRKRMQDEVREIMSQYMPLNPMEHSDEHVDSNGRA